MALSHSVHQLVAMPMDPNLGCAHTEQARVLSSGSSWFCWRGIALGTGSMRGHHSPAPSSWREKMALEIIHSDGGSGSAFHQPLVEQKIQRSPVLGAEGAPDNQAEPSPYLDLGL